MEQLTLFTVPQEEAVIALRDAYRQEGLSSTVVAQAQSIIYDYYREHRRPFPWRDEISPYRVVVSEIMLQQTQTDRVVAKFDQFIAAFPDFGSLAQASFEEVLACWKGLGYNRRARALHQIAQRIVAEYNGDLPNDPLVLETFPGIGHATARSIVAFAYDIPTVFIETNLRTVCIYLFFEGQQGVHDKMIFPILEKICDYRSPRAWCYALMDYGVMLKKRVGNLCKLSAHYAKQSKFHGSDRQLRGKILQCLLDHKTLQCGEIAALTQESEERVERLINDLAKDGLLVVCPRLRTVSLGA